MTDTNANPPFAPQARTTDPISLAYCDECGNVVMWALRHKQGTSCGQDGAA